MKIDVEMEVRVRKHEVNIEGLKKLLKTHKNSTNKEIASILGKPETLVAHWFRQDRYFAIPDDDIWFRLKELLNIQTDEFDKQIMEFETKGGSYDINNRIHIGEVSPTLTIGCGNDMHLL